MSKISANKKSFSRSVLTVICLGTCPGLWAYDIAQKTEVSSQKPVNIRSSQLTFDRLKGLTIFKKNVEATHDQVVLDSDLLKSIEGNKEAAAEGHVKVVDPTAAMTLTCGSLEYLDLMNTMTAHDHPLLVSLDENGRPISIKGKQMEMDSVKKTVVINQNVEIFHDNGHAESQKATYFSSDQTFLLEDQPKVFTDNGQLTGRRIVSKLTGDRSIIVEGMADAVFNPAGSVKIPDEKKGGTDSKGAKKEPENSTSLGPGGDSAGGGKAPPLGGPTSPLGVNGPAGSLPPGAH